MDVHAVQEAGERAISWARDGNGPYILEMRTERYRGHSLSDPAKYRRKDEGRTGQEPDPLERQRERLLRENLASEADLKQIDTRIRAIVVDAAELCPMPGAGAGELMTDILI